MQLKQTTWNSYLKNGGYATIFPCPGSGPHSQAVWKVLHNNVQPIHICLSVGPSYSQREYTIRHILQ